VTVRIRPATDADQRVIRRMVQGACLDPTGLHWSHFVVAENDGKVIGIGQLRPYPKGPELGSLVVRKAYRSRGIGGQIIERLLASQPGDVYLECQSDLAFYYSRFGFEEIRWQGSPLYLKIKAGLIGNFVGKLLGFRLAVMKYTRRE
jgi:N-acetylglutamate synthase-like GNAT family acetyltransferase